MQLPWAQLCLWSGRTSPGPRGRVQSRSALGIPRALRPPCPLEGPHLPHTGLSVLGRREEDERTGGREHGICPESDGEQALLFHQPPHFLCVSHSEHLTATWMIPEFTSVFPFQVIKKQTKPTNHTGESSSTARKLLGIVYTGDDAGCSHRPSRPRTWVAEGLLGGVLTACVALALRTSPHRRLYPSLHCPQPGTLPLQTAARALCREATRAPSASSPGRGAGAAGSLLQ